METISVSPMGKGFERPSEDALRAEAALRLLAVAGHDLKQPLSVALFCIQRAIAPSRAEVESDFLRIAEGALIRLNDDLEDIAMLSQAGASLKPNIKPVELDHLLGRVKEATAAYAAACDVRLTFSFPDRIVMTDPRMFQSILKNLIWNAIKFSNRGATVDIVASPSDGKVEIEVRDRGCGIRSEDLTKVFDAFERSSQNGGPIEGLGLGLHIVRQTAQALAHPISVSSTLGAGTTMSVTVREWSACGANQP
ncbi:sensor histidine kinase [Chenggangzhangella methanolivorans]|uniref:histidine kinase n=1 Tax=Chenggangzhangella methanolivorans TaxID=1437009 RepID=A0A9E6RBK6_9HYPH|nr:HAMP domain-containing sensor histidine kinase [Chenggangzhangella methanolivorans]QZO01769.1 HAMP domain-containing histidine kinase [Chenggangzhangella methanolivorans]